VPSWQISAGEAAADSGRFNEYLAGGAETPLGGDKLSGYGREKGVEALHRHTQLKCVTVRL
jgi:aldehyde dehydrogenase (NAD+)